MADAKREASKGAKKSRKKLTVTQWVLIACGGVAVVGGIIVAAILFLFSGDKKEEEPEIPPEKVEEMRRKAIKDQRETLSKQMEFGATWQDYHCRLMGRYYAFPGDDVDLPLALLLGLEPGASQEAIDARCDALLPTVRLMGGWPNEQRAQDNIPVCEGVEFRLRGKLALRVRPKAADLRQGQVAMSIDGKTYQKQRIYKDRSTSLAQYTPIIAQADDRCVIISAPRVGKAGKVAGSLRRIDKFAEYLGSEE